MAVEEAPYDGYNSDLIGDHGWRTSKGSFEKFISAVAAGIGAYLVIDDIEDLQKDIKKFFDNFKGPQTGV